MNEVWDTSHLDSQVFFFHMISHSIIIYSCYVVTTISISNVNTSPPLIPTPDKQTEAWDPFFFFIINNYCLQIVSIAQVSFFLCFRTVYYSINIIWLHICPIIYGWIRMYEIAESNYFLNYVIIIFQCISMYLISGFADAGHTSWQDHGV